MIKKELQCLKISKNGRFIVLEDETPFFWLGDTAWELFHVLNREEADLYLKNRAEKGFNVIQAVALGECHGLTVNNAYGRKPLLKNSEDEFDPSMPDLDITGSDNYTYWDHVDYIIEKADELGMYIGFLPTWGDKFNICLGSGPEIFSGKNARQYGKWLGERYKDRRNIIWILGGDRSLNTSAHFEVINEMAHGIKEGDCGKHLMTLHPAGGYSSSHFVHDEKWLDFNMIQSGHNSTNQDNYSMVEADYNRKVVKPTLDGEPRYEDHPIHFNAINGYFDDYDVRQAAYWAVFAGSCGHTYGHHSIWSMCTEPGEYFIMHWKDAIDRPGSSQVKYLRALIESKQGLDRVPDQEFIAVNYIGSNHMQATRGKDYAFIYSPNGLMMKIKMGIISGSKVNAYWYDPRMGKTHFIDLYKNEGIIEFVPPSSGRNNDWVLILDMFHPEK